MEFVALVARPFQICTPPLDAGGKFRPKSGMYRILGADRREYGPVSAEQLRRWINEGRANAETLVRAEGETAWRPLAQFGEFQFAAPPVSPAPFPPPRYGLARRTNSFAVAGLVFGILSITGGLCCYGLPFNILGLVFSLIGLAQIKGSPELYDGQGMAIAGLVLSILGLLVMLGLISLVALGSAFSEPVHPFRRL